MTEEDDACYNTIGEWYPEHDFGDYECRRCGAEVDDNV